MRKSVLLLSFIGMSCPALAQAPPSAATPPAPSASSATNCTPTQSTQQGTVVPQGNGSAANNQRTDQLGDKLAKSDGVLCPPNGVDPEIRAPTPNSGNTPVIPPPGSPGGDTSVRPK